MFLNPNRYMAGTEKKWRDWETHPTVLSHRAWPGTFSLDMVPLSLRCNKQCFLSWFKQGFPCKFTQFKFGLGKCLFQNTRISGSRQCAESLLASTFSILNNSLT